MILKQFDGAAVAPRDDAILYNAIIKKNGVFKGVEITHVGSNQLHITAGHGILKGRLWEQEEETIHCNLATSGTLKGRAYIHMDLTDMDSPIRIMTVADASLPELIQDEDCNYTNGIYEMELCTYDVTDLAISNLEVTYNNISGILPIIEKMTDIAALTEKGYVADALLVAELNKKIDDRDAAFLDGLSQIAASITEMGVTTASNASPDTMAANIRKLLNGSLTLIKHDTALISADATITHDMKGHNGKTAIVVFASAGNYSYFNAQPTFTGITATKLLWEPTLDAREGGSLIKGGVGVYVAKITSNTAKLTVPVTTNSGHPNRYSISSYLLS